MTSAALDLDHMPLVDQYFKISDTESEFDLFELHHQLKQNYLDQKYDINLWESLLPMFILPQTHYFPDLVLWCQAIYNPLKRTILAQNEDIPISITPETINEMFFFIP